MKNRDGYEVEVSPIKSVEFYKEGGCAITREEPGWGTFGLSASELNGFKPQVGDIVIVYTKGFSMIRGVVIDGHVLRYTTPVQADAEHEQWQKNYRLEKLERYIKHGAALKERAKNLPAPLAKRMARFDTESGLDFWIDSAGYEMAVMDGAAALLRKVLDLHLVADINDVSKNSAENTQAAVDWIKDWWNINSDKHDPPYDYAKQMEIVPDFGDGHSGNTAGAAYSIAIAILEGNEV